MTATGLDDPLAAHAATVVDVPAHYVHDAGSPSQVVHVATAHHDAPASPFVARNSFRDGAVGDAAQADSPKVDPALGDGDPAAGASPRAVSTDLNSSPGHANGSAPATSPLHHSVVARVFSTMYVSGSGSSSANASGLSPFDRFGWQSASGFASGSAPSSRAAMANRGAAGAGSASGWRSRSGSGSTTNLTKSSTQSSSASGSGSTQTTSGRMFAALDAPSSGSGSGSGKQTFSSGDNDSYSGGGSVTTSGSGTTSGGSTSGGSTSGAYWQQSGGLKTYNNSIENNAGYSASGGYSHPVPGGEVSGDLDEGGHNDDSSDRTKYVKYSGGVWTTSSGSGSQTSSSGAHWSFNGSGPYSAAVSVASGINETVSGTVSESAGSATSVSQSDDYELDVANNAWVQDGAHGKTSNVSHGSVSYSGGGTYSSPVSGGTVSGAVHQSGHYGSSADFTTHSTASGSDGAWQTTGNGSVTVASGQSLNWSGSGSYADAVNGNVVTGTVTQSGASSFSDTTTLALTAQSGSWAVTAGTGSTADAWNNDNSYSGGGPYSYRIDGGAMQGTLQESGYDNQSSDYTTKSKLTGGAWSSSGTGSETSSTGRSLLFSGSGGFSYAVPGGSVQGTADENGSSDVSETQTERMSLVAGLWQQTSGTGSTSDSGSDTRTFQGSGSFQATLDGIGLHGTILDQGGDGSTYDYTTKAKFSAGAWQTSGTGSSDDHGHHTHVYGGGGSASSVTTNGNVQTAFSATVSESGSDQGTYDYKTKAKYVGSGWTDSGSGTASASVVATSIYNDKIVTTFASSSSGPNGSSQSKSKDTATHFEKLVGSSGFAEHYELFSDGWFMDSRAAGGADSDNKVYTDASSASASSVVTYGSVAAGGNGTRDVVWSQDQQSHDENYSAGSKWSTLTTSVPGGATTTVGTASGGEEAGGTADDTLKRGHEHDKATSYPGYAMTSMSAASSTRVRHDEYHDNVTWGQHEVPGGSAGGSGSGTSSGSGSTCASGDGMVTTTGSGSFHVSGYENSHGTAHWSGSLTTGGGSGSGSASGSGSTQSGGGSTSWASDGYNYSMAVDYWGFAQSPYSGGSVYFEPQQPWDGPGSPQWPSGRGLQMDSGASETEPGPPGGPLAGTVAGPSPDEIAHVPPAEAVQPEALVSPAPFESGLDNALALADGEVNAPTAAAAPAEAGEVKGAVQAEAAEGQGFFNVPDGDQRLKDRFGGLGIPFSAGSGPVSVVGIVGGGERPPGETGGYKEKNLAAVAKGIANSGLWNFIDKTLTNMWLRDGKDREVSVKGSARNPLPQVYGSSNEEIIPGTDGKPHPTFKSKTAQTIANEQFKLITDTIGKDGGKLPDKEVYRLLLIGHSWGADKAIEVTNILGKMLADPKNGLDKLYASNKIQIHLVTLDAIKQGTATGSDRALEKNKGVRVASWLNLNQTTDEGFGVLPRLVGGGFPGFDDDHTLNVDASVNGLDEVDGVEGKPRHARMPMAVAGTIQGHLFPPDKP